MEVRKGARYCVYVLTSQPLNLINIAFKFPQNILYNYLDMVRIRIVKTLIKEKKFRELRKGDKAIIFARDAPSKPFTHCCKGSLGYSIRLPIFIACTRKVCKESNQRE